jgi:hypothetical protein
MIFRKALVSLSRLCLIGGAAILSASPALSQGCSKMPHPKCVACAMKDGYAPAVANLWCRTGGNKGGGSLCDKAADVAECVACSVGYGQLQDRAQSWCETRFKWK